MLKINPDLDILSELDHHISKYNIKDEAKRLEFAKETYRQFIRLIAGEAALNKVDQYIADNIEHAAHVLYYYI